MREIERVRKEEMGFGLVGHDGTEMPSSFHPCPLVGNAQFNIRGAVRAYSIYLDIDYLGTSTTDIYSTDSASSSQIFYDPTHMAHAWNRQHQVMVQYDVEGRPVWEIAQEMHSFLKVLVRRLDIISVKPKD
ncbi:hypothetical protein COCNU_scaffold006487G000010 [Cocos nucifera]|nr:hypothetical protein [Cocos nucifera]